MVVLDRSAVREDLSTVPESAVLHRGRMDDDTQLFLPPERQLSIVYAVPLRGWLFFSRLTTKGAITRVYDKGEGRGALVVAEANTFHSSGAKLCRRDLGPVDP